jgi:LPS sulfotransferase NodH
MGLVDGHKEYTRFIILGRSRTGSNLLRGLLNSHSQAVVLGELFQNRETIGWAYPGYTNSPATYSMFLNDPIRFLEKKVYKRFPRNIKAVGFKIFYYHAQDGTWKPVWTYLKEQRDIKIIHIKRKNILRTHLSRRLAAMTDTWVDTNSGRQNQKVVSLDYMECLRDFEQTREWEQTSSQLFFEHEILDIFYEDLAANYLPEVQRVEKLLGIENETVKPQTFKQTSQPLALAISNYAELKAQFAGSQWSSFFEE